MDWVGKDLKNHPVPNLLVKVGTFPLNQVARSPIQSSLEHI